MLRLEAWVEVWRARAEDFRSGGDKSEIYLRCVEAALADSDTARLFGKRDGVDRDAVRQRMRTVTYRRYATLPCPSPALDEAVVKLHEIQGKRDRVAGETHWNWGCVCFLIALGALLLLIFGGPLALLTALVLAATVMLFRRGSQMWSNLIPCLVAGELGFSWLMQRIVVGMRAAEWGETLQRDGTEPVVADLVRHMLGDDPDSLFIPDRFEWGLRAPREALFVIENGSRRQLERKDRKSVV